MGKMIPVMLRGKWGLELPLKRNNIGAMTLIEILRSSVAVVCNVKVN